MDRAGWGLSGRESSTLTSSEQAARARRPDYTAPLRRPSIAPHRSMSTSDLPLLAASAASPVSSSSAAALDAGASLPLVHAPASTSASNHSSNALFESHSEKHIQQPSTVNNIHCR
jgi:hypothetical protein